MDSLFEKIGVVGSIVKSSFEVGDGFENGLGRFFGVDNVFEFVVFGEKNVYRDINRVGVFFWFFVVEN